jgi:class 3 adenylate cyclase/pimeloyl-ACP methyl ester carboxylesterase
VDVPETRYAKSGDVHIAYQVVGEGPPDLVYVPVGFHHVELTWEFKRRADFLRRLASHCRLLRFDKRGTGMSDRIAALPILEARMDDIRAVMDAAGSESAVLFGAGEGGFVTALFAATYPERTTGLILFNSRPRQTRSPDMPWLSPRAELEQGIGNLPRRWGDLDSMAEGVRRGMPSATEEELRQWARIARLSHSPGTAAAYLQANVDVDIREVLPSIRLPTLVMYRAGVKNAQPNARYLADRIPTARLVELPGSDMPPDWGDQEPFFAVLEGFFHDLVEGNLGQPDPDRVLTTVLFTDIVDATARASALGDRAWGELLGKHYDAVRAQLGSFRGREVDTAGDGFFATFDGPARAIRCACAIREAVRALGLEIRAGLHTGECELVGGKATGIAVHLGARVAAQAEDGEVLVSGTVKDLVAGSGITFESRGVRELKGLGEWPLYAVAQSD